MLHGVVPRLQVLLVWGVYLDLHVVFEPCACGWTSTRLTTPPGTPVLGMVLKHFSQQALAGSWARTSQAEKADEDATNQQTWASPHVHMSCKDAENAALREVAQMLRCRAVATCGLARLVSHCRCVGGCSCKMLYCLAAVAAVRFVGVVWCLVCTRSIALMVVIMWRLVCVPAQITAL